MPPEKAGGRGNSLPQVSMYSRLIYKFYKRAALVSPRRRLFLGIYKIQKKTLTGKVLASSSDVKINSYKKRAAYAARGEVDRPGLTCLRAWLARATVKEK